MKRCPQCNSTYTDETLSFCLTDGAALVEDDPAKTEAFSAAGESEKIEPRETGRGRVNIEIGDAAEQSTIESQRPERSGSGVSKLVVAMISLLLLVFAGATIGLAIYLFYFSQGPGKDVASNMSNERDAEIERLKQRVEELGNRIVEDPESEDENTDTEIPVPTVLPEDDGEYDEEVIQRVNSPGDGFLALRDRPSATEGSRIARIPHGDIVVLGRCLDREETIGGRTGHWCRVKWEGRSGWVFDVWLID